MDRTQQKIGVGVTVTMSKWQDLGVISQLSNLEHVSMLFDYALEKGSEYSKLFVHPMVSMHREKRHAGKWQAAAIHPGQVPPLND